MKKQILLSIALLSCIGLQGKKQAKKITLPAEEIFKLTQKYAALPAQNRNNKNPETLLSKNLSLELSDAEKELNKVTGQLNDAQRVGPRWWDFFECHTREVVALAEIRNRQQEKIKALRTVLREAEKIEDVLKNAKDTERGDNILHIMLRKLQVAKTNREAIELAELDRTLLETINNETDLFGSPDWTNHQGETPRDLFQEMFDQSCNKESKDFDPDACARCAVFSALSYPQQ